MSTDDINVVELAQTLIHFDTTNPPGDEEACAHWLAGILASQGFSTRLETFGPHRFNLVAERGDASRGPVLAFAGHLDTVPLGAAAWTEAPFGGEVRDGRLYGRGASDMKAGIAAFIAACGSVDGNGDRGAVRLLLTGGEETGCDGAKALAACKADYLTGIGALIIGEPTANYPFIGHKGALWLRCTATGVAAHGSMPEAGDNAVYKAVRAIDRIRSLSFDARHPLMGAPTLNVGTFRGGINVNSVPDRAEFEIDIRTVPGMRHEDVSTEVVQHLGEQVTLISFVDLPPLLSDCEHPWLLSVFKLCSSYHGGPLEAGVVPYFTDGSVLVPACGSPPTVILGPGEPQLMHKTDEYCRIDRLHAGVQLYRSIVSAWLERPAAA